jgi:hypothetical protein
VLGHSAEGSEGAPAGGGAGEGAGAGAGEGAGEAGGAGVRRQPGLDEIRKLGFTTCVVKEVLRRRCALVLGCRV